MTAKLFWACQINEIKDWMSNLSAKNSIATIRRMIIPTSKIGYRSLKPDPKHSMWATALMIEPGLCIVSIGFTSTHDLQNIF